ncbi:Mini-ribonuclease 3 [Catenisphaera adipataccumulans]|jgi:ribonuclease-3 family protein|uniref:Mini-ribonuclease 3 n=1 Tax=Catenisphaera adipataccumulans TaxID=700500 RepID=A0A7W8FWT4_9FIRM|nr:ribonuclease III domain-containing protein [Catenisphaera adipataccumulans]MBB5183641.1 ribonuclease-3 family protein [Catenisphaera adipataccumulans]
MEIVTENATSLAWIGDAVMTLRIREELLKEGYRKADVLQKKSARICSAKGQAHLLDQLMAENFFNEDEQTILARGRNATIHSKAKNADVGTYLKATALESVLGYLYLYHHEKRLQECLDKLAAAGKEL